MEPTKTLTQRILDVGEVCIEKLFNFSFISGYGVLALVAALIIYQPILLGVGIFASVIFIIKVYRQIKNKDKQVQEGFTKMETYEMIFGVVAVVIILFLTLGGFSLWSYTMGNSVSCTSTCTKIFWFALFAILPIFFLLKAYTQIKSKKMDKATKVHHQMSTGEIVLGGFSSVIILIIASFIIF